MVDNLQRFHFYQRASHWSGYLSEAANMLPFLEAAGHHKYGLESLPLFLQEIKAHRIHELFMDGGFVAWRSNGSFNPVSPT